MKFNETPADTALGDQPSFDPKCVTDIQRYQNLSTNEDRMTFIWMVQDYMKYVRSNPRERAGWDEDAEKLVALQFVTAIRSELGWPLARHAAPEFQMSM